MEGLLSLINVVQHRELIWSNKFLVCADANCLTIIAFWFHVFSLGKANLSTHIPRCRSFIAMQCKMILLLFSTVNKIDRQCDCPRWSMWLQVIAATRELFSMHVGRLLSVDSGIDRYFKCIRSCTLRVFCSLDIMTWCTLFCDRPSLRLHLGYRPNVETKHLAIQPSTTIDGVSSSNVVCDEWMNVIWLHDGSFAWNSIAIICRSCLAVEELKELMESTHARMRRASTSLSSVCTQRASYKLPRIQKCSRQNVNGALEYVDFAWRNLRQVSVSYAGRFWSDGMVPWITESDVQCWRRIMSSIRLCSEKCVVSGYVAAFVKWWQLLQVSCSECM